MNTAEKFAFGFPLDTTPRDPGFYFVNRPNGRVNIVNETGKVLATSSGIWWEVVDGVEWTPDLDNFITTVASEASLDAIFGK